MLAYTTLLYLFNFLDEYSVTFSENIQVGSQVVRTSATDIDQDIITYSIINGNEVNIYIYLAVAYGDIKKLMNKEEKMIVSM